MALSDTVPKIEVNNPQAGVLPEAARADHQHPRPVSATRVTLAADGTATVTYTRSFPTKPVVNLTAINPSGRQIILEQTTDIQTGGVYTGCTIKGSRTQIIPALTNVLLVTDLVTILANWNPVGTPAAGVEVNMLVVLASG